MDIGENCYLRRARKPWRCGGTASQRAGSSTCVGTILPGMVYIECIDSVPLYQSGDRYCLPCARIQLSTMVDWTRVPQVGG